MPFILRNKKGEITGLFSVQQQDGQEFLPDDNSEVVEFNKRQPPLPKDFLHPLTEAERKQSAAEHEVLQREHERLNASTPAFFRVWTELELALSGLLYEILYLSKPSHIAQAIYFTPDSLHVRTQLVHNSVLQLIEEQKELADLEPLWGKVFDRISKVRNMRNNVAHGSPVTLSIGEKKYAKITSPPFDPIRVWRRIAKGEKFGVTADELSQAVSRVKHLLECVDDVNRAIVAFRNEPSTFQEKLRVLQDRLTMWGSL